MFIIYKATCGITNKVYIGLSKKTLIKRKLEHIYAAKTNKYDIKFHRALIKHNYDFSWEIIDKCFTKKEACSLEKYYIALFNSYKNGYNSTLGGDGISNPSNEVKNKIRNSLYKYHNLPKTRLKHSRERGGKSFYVFKITGEFVAKFDTQVICCENLNLSKSKINQCLHKKRKSHKGYIFSFNNTFPYEISKDDYIKRTKLKVSNKLTGKCIGYWDSIKSCAKDLNMTRNQIQNYVLNKVNKNNVKHHYHFEVI